MNGMQASETPLTPDICLPPQAQTAITTPIGLSITTLRQDPDTGAKSLILKSAPRSPGQSRPHFHASCEEVFNLGPTMTFDAGRPLPHHGYALYPAQMPHGTAVDLPQGYHLFVRYSGSSDVHFDDDACFNPSAEHLYVPDPFEDWSGNPGPFFGDGITTRALSPSSCLARLSDAARLDVCCPVELLVLSGMLVGKDGDLPPESYLYSSQGLPPLRASSDTLLLVHFT